ncbi:MAG: sensor histidine kinase [bacterium]
MQRRDIWDRFWWKLSLIFGIATLFGLFFTTQSYLTYVYRNHNPDFLASLSVTIPDWYVWAVLTPFIFWLAQRFPFERGKWARSLLLHLVIGILVTSLKLFLVSAMTQLISWLPSRSFSAFQIHSNVLTYWAIVGVRHAFGYYRKFKERELHASQLESQLAHAQLQVLKMQLQPHFLFNTLHAISTLIHKDPEAADRMIAQLSDLLRLTLKNVGVQEVTLKQELDLLKNYLEIEQTRFQDRLIIKNEIEPQSLDALVPNMILQPLVENAIRHGIEPRSTPGVIEIKVRRNNGMLELKIHDDGPGTKTAKLKEGVGLANTRARLQQLYGEHHRFEFTGGKSTGFCVTLCIPYKPEDGAAVLP